MDPIEDRDGDGIPDINVRWEAEIGDYCTYQGLPVACGEGDGPGMGGSADGLPSLTGDNCQDDQDNDGDGTCDINGCTAFPGIGDPDCKVDIDDIEFAVWLPVSAQTVVQRPLKLHCKPRSDPYPYTLTLYNEEWPFNPEDPGEEWIDPDPESNFQVLDIEVTCQVAEPHYKCYDISDIEPPFVGELVTLEDQFHTQTGVQVTYAEELCPPAIKYVDGEYAGGGAAATHLKCYEIVGMPDADATVNLTTQFGTETDIDVGMARRLCIPTLKEVVSPDPAPPPPPPVPLEPHYVCYDIVGDAPPPGLTIDLETQFGTEADVELASSGLLCAPALKNSDGDLTAPHLRCYYIVPPLNNPPHIVNLETQFGLETDVEVNEASFMCVPAEKELVGGEADVKILSQTIYAEDCMSPPPGEIPVSGDVNICVRKVLHNNGPYGPVSVDIAKTASAPQGCTILPLNPTFQVDLDVSLDSLVHDEWFTIHCDEPSTHGPFTIDNVITIKDPGVTDPDPLNNAASSTLTVDALAYADVQIVGQQILAANCLDPAPTEIPLSESVTICVHKLLHNNGPYAAQPVHVDVTKTAWASAGATILPPTHTEQVELYFSDVVPHVEYFTIHCYEPSTHEFRVDNDVTVKDEHVIDPDGASASGSIFVDCLASTDIKITSQTFLDPPAQMTVGVPEIVTLRKQLHNNGGYGPATVDINKTAYTDSPSATIAPPSATAQVVLPVSVPVTHDEDFTLSCSAPGTYTYTVDNDVTSKEPHISGGDFASTDLIVECTEGAPQEIKWAQLPDDSPWGLDVSAYEPFVLAEDFLCNESGLITKIDFWASWYNDEPPGMDPNMVAFILSLHSDVPAGEDLPWSHPGETVWMQPFDPYDCTAELWGMGEEGWLEPPDMYIPFADTQIWLYSCPIPQPSWFQQEEGTIYWLDIQAFPMLPGSLFGWKTSIDHWNDDGVWAIGAEPVDPLAWYELRYPPGHPLFPESIDLAFQIWGQECDPLLDSDGDGFTDAVECYLPTDFRDDCPDWTGTPGLCPGPTCDGHDAWPLDMNVDKVITVSFDVLPYRGRIQAKPGDPNWLQRLDLNMDSVLTVSFDVLPFRGHIQETCT